MVDHKASKEADNSG